MNSSPSIGLDFTQPQVFLFDKRSNQTNKYVVADNQTYTESLGYGFDLQTQRNSQNKPFFFSAHVPEGNYRVTVEFGHESLASANTLRAETRRLYVKNLTTKAGEFVTRNFIVNVRNNELPPPELNAPGFVEVKLKEKEQHRLHWDNKLTLEFNGDAPQVRSVTLQRVDVPTIYLIGDSTVTDQAYEPAASWGQMLPYFFSGDYFNGEIAIANHAESGETMKSFIMTGRLAKTLQRMKAGDYLFIQFGHNDQKIQWPQTYVEATTTYKDYLRTLIGEARLRGATPVLITSMQRRTFNEAGKIVNSHGLYPQAVREVAIEKNLTLVDLDTMSVKFYEALGPNKAPLAFNDNGKDATHHNNYGAYEFARCVAESIRQSSLPLTAQLAKLPPFNPAHPDAVENFSLSPSPLSSKQRPDGN
ncbi:rhamnogalacturonan acetylesterase [Cellvibrio sp. NN19]|uniref:rhamnogalacturonan acetylesterase n=1 Tax=Cellvibrio chitinivorans TaxID=3102792 RepID=UPI002B4026ED|nr:rhamnogalacturonan acetylesterase [Cellvibrio sp. NN19]